MLGVLAPVGDSVASAVLRAADRLGVPAVRISDLTDLTVSIHVERSGRPMLAPLGHQTGSPPLTAIVNRYPWNFGHGELTFAGAERMATWWALLAGFQGRLINRPNIHGLYSGTHRCVLAGVPTRRQRSVFGSPFTPEHDGVLASLANGSRQWVRAGNSVYVGTEGSSHVELDARRIERYLLVGWRFYRDDGSEVAPAEHPVLHALLSVEIPAIAEVIMEAAAEDSPGPAVLVAFESLPSAHTLGDALWPAIATLITDLDAGR